jgi:hypothetical protein
VYLEGLLAALLYAAGALLVAAGIVKLRRPRPTAEALAGVGLPSRGAVVWSLGSVEIVVGVGVLLWPAALAAGIALLYACFSGFVTYVIARGLPLRSCGCLGETDTEPSRVHVAVTAIAAAVGLAGALAPPPSVPDLLADAPVAGGFFVATVTAACYLTYLVLVSLPEAFGAYRQQVRTDD